MECDKCFHWKMSFACVFNGFHNYASMTGYYWDYDRSHGWWVGWFENHGFKCIKNVDACYLYEYVDYSIRSFIYSTDQIHQVDDKLSCMDYFFIWTVFSLTARWPLLNVFPIVDIFEQSVTQHHSVFDDFVELSNSSET